MKDKLIKVNEDADMLKVLRRIPLKQIFIKGKNYEQPNLPVLIVSAIQGMKL